MPKTYRSLEGYENLSPLDKFGKLLMQHLRDVTIEYYEGLTVGRWKGQQELQRKVQSLSDEQQALIRDCLLSAIDTGMHDFLFKLQEQTGFENSIQVHVDGTDIIATSDGLQGHLYSEDGWVAKFSKYKEVL